MIFCHYQPYKNANLISDSRSYPNDSEKLMLASQTGLNKNQVIPYPRKKHYYPFFVFSP